MNKSTSSRRWYVLSAIVLSVCIVTLAMGKSRSPQTRADSANTPPPAQTSTPSPVSPYLPLTEPQVIEPPAEPIPARLVIQFAPNTTEEQRAAYIESVGGTVVENIDALDTVVVTLPEEAAQEPLPESPVVEQSEPDYFVVALDETAPPNDPRYAEQWALPAIGAPVAWAEMPADAPTVLVAVIDSGICASHADLAGRIAAGGWDFLEDDAIPQDDFGHGCSVSGVIAANINNGIGIAGVAPNAQIMPLRVLNASGLGSYSDVAAAIVYAADNGAQVINLSLGGSNPSSTLENAVNYAISKGMIVVAAAGNNGTEGALYPAAYPDVIAVGSVDPNLQHSSFSNYGSQIDIWAPGRDILTTKRDGGYGLVSGTSFAAPYVAGAEILDRALGQALAQGGVLRLDNQSNNTQTPTLTPEQSIATLATVEPTLDLPPVTSTSILPTPDAQKPLLVIQRDETIQVIDLENFTTFDVGPASRYHPGMLPNDGSIVLDPTELDFDLSLVEDDLWEYRQGVYSPDQTDFVYLESNIFSGEFNVWLVTIASRKINLLDTSKQQPGVLPLWPIGWLDNDTILLGERTEYDGGYLSLWTWHRENSVVKQEAFSLSGSILSLSPDRNILASQDNRNTISLFNLRSAVTYQVPLLATGKRAKLLGWILPSDLPTFRDTLEAAEPVVPQLASRFLYWPTFVTRNVTCPYGGCMINGVWYPHTGIDIANGANFQIVAAASGTVLASGESAAWNCSTKATDPRWSSKPNARVVIISHVTSDGTYKSIYLHTQSESVNVNATLSAGDNIAIAGDTGCSTGTHLHFEVRDSSNTSQDPNSLFIDANNDGTPDFPPKEGGNQAPTSPILLSPSNGSSLSSTPQLCWSASSDPESNYPLTYNVSLWGTANQSSGWTSSTCWTPSNLPSGNYSWNVSAKDSLGKESGASSAWSFSINQTQPPSGDTVTVYVDPGLTNTQYGWHDPVLFSSLPDYVAEQVSSIWIANGWSARIYEHENAGGGEKCYNSTDDNFSGDYYDTGNSVDNSMSSIMVYNQETCPALEPVILYDTGGLRGQRQTWSSEVSENLGGLNNIASSIRIQPGWSARLFQNPDQGGGSICFNSTDTDFNGDTYDNGASVNESASSIIVYNQETCPPLPPPSPPSGLAATKGDYADKVWVGWLSSTGATRYELWRSTSNSSGSAVRIADNVTGIGSIIEYEDTSAVLGTTYYYWAKACNASGCSNFSNSDYGYRSGGGTGLNCDQVSYTGVILYENYYCNRDQNGRTKFYSAPTGWIDIVSDFNDITSSIYVTPGWSVKVYEAATFDFYNGAYGGSWRCIDHNMGNLSTDKYTNINTNQIIDDTISSIRVYDNSACNDMTVNLLANGGFEDGSILPDLWRKDAWTMAYSTFTWDTAQKHSGSRSVKIANDTSNDARWIQTVYVQPNSDYLLSGWIKTQNVAQNNSAGANLSILGGFEHTAGLFDTHDWTYVSLPFNSGSRTQVDIAARLGMYSGTTTGVAWFDDLKVELLGTPICYTLTKNVNPSGSGVVNVVPSPNCNNGTQYIHGTTVKLTAVPNTGYRFGNWDGDATGSANPVYLTMNSNKLVTANIVQDTYQLSVNKTGSGNGTVTSNPAGINCGTDCSENYATSTTVNLFAAPLAGSVFTGWSGACSGISTCTVTMDAAKSVTAIFHLLPTVPTLVNPANASLTNDNTPTFSWNAASNGETYQIQIDNSSAFTSPEQDFTGAPGELSYTAATLPDGLYYWRVRAISNLNVLGSWSASRSFTVDTISPPSPTLSSPAVNASIRGTPAFTWLASATAARYQFQYDDSADCNSPLYTSPEITATSHTPPAMQLGTFYWCVRAGDAANNWSAWSSPRAVNIIPPIPAAPVLVSPANALATNDTTPTFSWNSVAYGHVYSIQIDNNSTFVSPEQSYLTWPGELNYTASALANGTYYWRVKAINANNESGPWSAARSLIIDTVAPSVPIPNSPANNGFTSLTKPTLSVLAVTGATRYQFQVSVDTGFGTPLVDVTSATASYALTPAQALPYGIYYWRVRAMDAAGNISEWSATRSFTVTIQTAPLNGAFVASVSPTFTWALVTGALEYHLQVDDTDTFDTPEIDRHQASGGSYVSPALDYGTHYWRMRVRTASGWGNWMPVWQFITTPPNIVPPVLSSPANAALLSSNAPTLTWNAVMSDDQYQVQIDNGKTFASPEQDVMTGDPGYTAAPLPDGIYYWRVRSFNYLGMPGPWSAYRSFTVDTTAPNPPLPSLPGDGASVNGIPTFKWLAPAGAVRYQFEYDNDGDFSSPILTSAELTTLSFKPLVMDVGNYFWHVRAKDAAGNWSAWSMAHTITILPLVPAAPVLTAPVNALTTNNTAPVFTWNAVAFGSTYQIEIATSTAFTTKIQTSTTSALTYTAAPLADGVYYWHVRAVNVNNQYGPWSAYRSFTVDTTAPNPPALSLPADGASVNGIPTFKWLAPAGAARYQFEYDNDGDFSSPILTSAELTAVSFKPAVMDVGTYFWHVRAKDAAGNWSAWSTARTVTILPLVPVAPVLSAPTNAMVTNNTTPMFTWNTVAFGDTYQIEIATSATFVIKVQAFTTDPGGLSYTANILADGIYYWRVRAINVNNQAGPWSAYRSFTIDTTAPNPPALSLPADGASVSGVPTFKWLASTGATRYQFEYDNDSNFSSPILTSAELTTVSFKPAVIEAGAYFWRVRAKDAAGNWSVWSAARAVTVIPLAPAVPTLLSPIHGSVSENPAPAFSWNAVPFGASYDIQIDNNSTFSSPEFIGTTPTASITPSSLPDGVYYWRVRSVNALGGTSAWSVVWRITIDQPMAAAPMLLLPADTPETMSAADASTPVIPEGTPTEQSGTPTFSWESADNGLTYQIQVDDNADFSSPEFDDVAETTSRTPPVALANGFYYWRVRAFNAYNTPGEWSATWKVIVNVPPDAPIQTSPVNGSTILADMPTFSWESVENATAYEIQIDNDADFSSPEFGNTSGMTTYTPSVPLPIGLYYWRVRAFNIFNTPGMWSPSNTVTIDMRPAAPTLLSPSDAPEIQMPDDGSTPALPEDTPTEQSGTPTFSWEAVANGAAYQIQVDNDPEFSEPEFDDTADRTSRIPDSPLDNGLYYWHVRAFSSHGTPGEWSMTWKVIINAPPVAPTQISPTDAAALDSGIQAFAWESVPNAEIYEIQLDNDANFSSPMVIERVAETAYAPTDPLENGVYYWRVRAFTLYGTPGEWSSIWTVAINVP